MAREKLPQRLVRLNKFLAQNGVDSRRKADRLIEEGRVRINGRKVFELGIQVDPHRDKVLLDGQTLRPQTDLIYFIFYKPLAVLTAMSDPDMKPTVGDYFKGLKNRIFPVGRLDWRTEGLLLMTNDGAWAERITKGDDQIVRTYLVKLNRRLTPEHVKKLREGVPVLGGRGRLESVERIDRRVSGHYEWYKVRLLGTSNRFLRKMFEKLNYDVIKLQSVAIGALRIGSLKPGDSKPLRPQDLPKVFIKTNTP